MPSYMIKPDINDSHVQATEPGISTPHHQFQVKMKQPGCFV